MITKCQVAVNEKLENIMASAHPLYIDYIMSTEKRFPLRSRVKKKGKIEDSTLPFQGCSLSKSNV
jgi:hypothetical protein